MESSRDLTKYLFLAAFLCLVSIQQGLSLRWLKFDVPSPINRGSDVVLTCEFNLEGEHLYSVKWYKNEEEFYSSTPRSWPPKKTSSKKGVWVDLARSDAQHVTLMEVDFESAGIYSCEVLGEGPKFTTLVKSGNMQIVDLPNGRPVVTGGEKKYRPGDTVSVNCTVPKSMPAANLTWYINNRQAPRKYLMEYPLDEDLEGRKGVTLGLLFTAQRCHFLEGQLTLKCTATVHSLYEEHALHMGEAAHPVSAHFGDNVNGSKSVGDSVRSLLMLSIASLLILFRFL